MRIGCIIIWFSCVCTAIQAQQSIDMVIDLLNQSIQEKVEYTLDTMFNGQDTIFTETDSFILYTTPDMVIEEIDTLTYQYINGTVQEWNHNGDEIADLIAVVYLADKRTGEVLYPKANLSLLVATGNEEESYDISYLEAVIACSTCGLEGSMPDISILTDENKIELIEVQGLGDIIYNDEYKMTFNDEEFIVKKQISAHYHQLTENVLTNTIDRKTMMRKLEFEPAKGDITSFKTAVLPADFTQDVIINGQLEDEAWNKDYKINWRPLHSTIAGKKHTMNDLFAKYSITWNNDYLFVAVMVKDDVLVPVEFTDDGLQGDYLQLDFNLDSSRMQHGQLVKDLPETHISYAIGFDKYGKPSSKNLMNLEIIEDIKVQFERQQNGYNAEIAIPLRGLKARQRIPFTISVGDADNRTKTTIQNIDASSQMEVKNAFTLGEIELFNKYESTTFTNIKNKN